MMAYLKNNLFVIIFIIIPFVTLWGAPDKYEWLARIFVLLVVFTSAIFFLFRYALSPKSKFILKGGKLNNPKYKKQKKITENILRIFVALFGLGLIVYYIVPFSLDVGLLITKGEFPLHLKGKVHRNTSTFGLWFFSQRLSISDIVSNKNQDFTLLYSLKPRLVVGQKYEFMILKRSKLILEIYSDISGKGKSLESHLVRTGDIYDK